MKHTTRTPFMPWRAQYSRCASETPLPPSAHQTPQPGDGPFSVEEVCVNALKNIHQRVRRKKPLIRLEIDHSIPRLVRGNGAQLENILHLLLSNVVALSSESQVQLSVVVRRFTPEGMEALFSIEWMSDTISMPSIPVVEGSAPPGLSFSICSSVITSMGGRLEVKKRKEGLEISFFLPFSTTDIPDNPRTPPVLLVEDNPMNRKIIAASLEHGGYAVRAAASGREALDILFDENWGIILMDIQMPDMDGLQTTLAIRAEEKRRGRRTPIVAITAYARPEDRDRCMAAGMDDYLAKPVKLETLLSTVGKVSGTPPARMSPARGEDAHSAIISFTEGDKELAQKVVGEFLALAPTILHSMRQAFDKKDRQELRLLSHRLKGNLAYFGEGEAFLLAEALHKEIDNLTEEAVAATLLSLLSETERLIEDLENEWEPSE